MTCDIDIEPDELIPEYVATKAKLLGLSRGQAGDDEDDADLAIAKLEAKLNKIETDILFDKTMAEQTWKVERVILERRLAATKQVAQPATSGEAKTSEQPAESESSDDDIAAEAERMAAEILAENDESDGDIAGLFASLPQHEVDSTTGKTQTVINSPDGTKLVLRDFGKWTGVSPRRILEEACRSRDAAVKIEYTVASEATFASRQSIDIWWTKAQEPPQSVPESDVEVIADQTRFAFTMVGVAAPDSKQSEAYIATSALFHVFSGNTREEKVSLRLPSVWKDLWNEMAEAKKNQLDSQDRDALRSLRTLVRRRHDQELEDGVILQGAFRGRGAAKASQDSSDTGANDRKKQNTANADEYRKIWADKSGSRKYQMMLVRTARTTTFVSWPQR